MSGAAAARLPGFLLLASLWGCSAAVTPPPAAPSDPPPAQNQLVDAPIPLPSPWPRVLGKLGRFQESFQQGLAAWRDVRQDGHEYSWLFPGVWVTRPSGAAGGVPAGLLHDEILRPPALSFRRYAGTAFGTDNGELPSRYRVSVTLTPIAAHELNYPPVGDLGVPIFYLDPLHYVEAVFKPDSFEIWACDGGLPSKWRGWHPLFQTELQTKALQGRRLIADVDAAAGTMTVTVDGKVMGTVRHALIQPYSHFFALRATGNRVLYSDLRIEGE